MQQQLPRFLLPSVVTAALLPAAALSQTLPDSWDRGAEWVVQPPSAAGTTQGNPAPDSAGNLVWHHDYVSTGGPLGSANPWYDEPMTQLVWDNSWFGQPGGAWVVSDDFGTVITRVSATHIYGCSGPSCWFGFQPVLRWVNVTNDAFDMRLLGSVLLSWNGLSGMATPVDVDFIVAHRAAGSGASTLLYSTTVSKPSDSSVPEELRLFVNTSTVRIEPGDEVRIAHRARDATTLNRWITVYDDLCMLRDPIGSPYCGPANPHSGGLPGLITALGSTDVSSSRVTLKALQLPPGQFGYFLAGQTQGSFNPPGSQGVLCLSGNIGRFNSASQIVQGPSGQLEVDLSAIPVNPTQAVQPGDTWNFQCWYRDSNPGATSNFTDAVSVTFQ